jgi:hypothetical protein
MTTPATEIPQGSLLTGLFSVGELEAAVEAVLSKQLLRERMRLLPNERQRELYEEALDGFEDWADQYGLPTTPNVLAAYLVELRCVHGVDIDDLKFIAEAYLEQHGRDVHVPIRAALKYCSR